MLILWTMAPQYCSSILSKTPWPISMPATAASTVPYSNRWPTDSWILFQIFLNLFSIVLIIHSCFLDSGFRRFCRLHRSRGRASRVIGHARSSQASPLILPCLWRLQLPPQLVVVLMACGHACGWPIVRGGAQTLTNVLAEYLKSLGGQIELRHEVTELPETDLTLADVSPRQLLRIVGSKFPSGYRRRLERFRYGAGAFKVDYTLSSPIPWTAVECSRAATVHLGGTLEEIASSERYFTSDAPFVLVVQPSLFDPTRAPAGQHTAWAYCHVPNGSSDDRLTAIERQIERFAPGFADCIMARSINPPSALEHWNSNLIGGDLSGGMMNLRQLLFRPTASLYRTPVAGLFLCGASTPPGGGVHGMAGFHAARAALRYLANKKI